MRKVKVNERMYDLMYFLIVLLTLIILVFITQ